MKLGKFTLRKPWVKLVDIPLEIEIYYAVKKSMLEDMLRQTIEDAHDTR